MSGRTAEWGIEVSTPETFLYVIQRLNEIGGSIRINCLLLHEGEVWLSILANDHYKKIYSFLTKKLGGNIISHEEKPTWWTFNPRTLWTSETGAIEELSYSAYQQAVSGRL